MSDVHTGNYRFGNSSEFPVDIFFVPPSGDVATMEVTLRTKDLNRLDGIDFRNAALDLGQTAMVLEGPEVYGQPTAVEVSVVHNEGSDADGFVGQFSTGSSSLHNNKLQPAEVAMRSAEDPTRKTVYITHPGQGSSSAWTPQETKYIKETGRYVQADGEPLPTMKAYAQALAAEGINISRVSCDADGASIATGMLIAQKADVTNIHFNGASIGSGSVLDEVANQVDDLATGLVSRDGARLSKYQIREALQLFRQGILDNDTEPELQDTVLRKARTSHTPQKLSLVTAGLTRELDESGVHPGVLDTAALLDRHPEASIVFHMVEKAMSAEEAVNFLAVLKGLVKNPATAGNVEIARTPGARRYHKAYPTLRRVIKRYAFDQRYSTG